MPYASKADSILQSIGNISGKLFVVVKSNDTHTVIGKTILTSSNGSITGINARDRDRESVSYYLNEIKYILY